MKNFTKFLTIAILVMMFSAAAQGQAIGTATASAVIMKPLTITTNTNLHFGTIMSSVGGGTVVVTPAGVRSVGSGTVSLSALAPAATAATFTVSGDPSETYSITLPSSALTITSGANSMTVDAWASNPTVAVGGTLGAGTGTQVLQVGATLNVGANQPSGTYGLPAETFQVTVNYN